MKQYDFYGNGKLDSAPLLQDVKPEQRGVDYLPSEALQQAVNVALLLQKPLLLTGLPGTGKTELAYHIANRFGWGVPLFFATRTDSTATDLLYRYDSLAHFHKVNIDRGEGCGELKASEIEERYIQYEALGEAIIKSTSFGAESSRRTVVLIDEIDKAPRDLPNDILSTIERMEFEVPELKSAQRVDSANGESPIWKKKGELSCKPVVILTSNSEKSLPDAFLRRCVFFHIEMPDDKLLMEILLRKKSLDGLHDDEATAFVALFKDLKKFIRGKEPATHELILWVWWMMQHGFTASDLRHAPGKSSVLLSGLGILAKEKTDLTKVTEAVTNGQLKEGSAGKSGQE